MDQLSPIIAEILIIFLLILVNGVFAMVETALVSARKTRLQQQAEKGDPGAQAALDLVNEPNRFLSTLQIGITLIGILAGAVGGASLAEALAVWLGQIVWLRPYAEPVSLILVVIAITYFSLVIGELIPKRLALGAPERISARLARPMYFLSRVSAPLVNLLGASTDLGLRLLGIRPSAEPPVTEEEIRGLIEQGTQVGVFEEAEQDMVESIFRLGARRVDALMVPRTEIVWLDIDEPLDNLLQKVVESHHSRFPVAQHDLDNVIGILFAKDLLANRLLDQHIDLPALLRNPLFVPESTPALKVLAEFKSTGTQMALVIDEYGGLHGMVTMYDIFESIVGDIRVIGQAMTPEAVQREDGSWLFDGMLQIDELKEILGLDMLPGEERAGYQTVGGFVMSQLGFIPSAGDHFEWDDLRFEVVDMDGRRVDKVLVQPQRKMRLPSDPR